MSIAEDISWFKQQFKDDIQTRLSNTPFTIDLITAIALQETGYLWRNIYKIAPVAEVLKLCVGDTIDSPDRSAFPTNKSDLLSKSKGNEMFTIARKALESIVPYNNGYKNAAKNPNRFCHGYGIFQYDLQFFLENPSFFLEENWYEFDECLNLCVDELENALRKTYGNNKTQLSDREMVYVAIAYNRGSVDFSRGLKQGHFDGEKYYGEYISEFLQLAKGTNLNTGQYEVTARSGLRMRSGPGTNFDVTDLIPFRSYVSIGRRQGEWVEVDLEGDGFVDGWAFASFLRPV
jgi:Bacterial SH3 domain